MSNKKNPIENSLNLSKKNPFKDMTLPNINRKPSVTENTTLDKGTFHNKSFSHANNRY